MKTLDELQALVNGYKRGSVRFDYLSDVLRELIADADRSYIALGQLTEHCTKWQRAGIDDAALEKAKAALYAARKG